MSFRPRSSAGVASLALVGLLALSACTSTPSHRRVVLDQIDALDLPAEEEACMNDVVATYENSGLKSIAEDNDNEALNWSDESALASASPELQEFVERLRGCVTGDSESTETTEASESSESSDTTDVTETTEAADTTEPVDTTEAVATSEAVETTEG